MCSMIPISDFKKEILYMGKKKKGLGVYIKMLTVVGWMDDFYFLPYSCLYFPKFLIIFQQ